MSNTQSPKIIVSACLCGVKCRYDAGSSPTTELKSAYEKGFVLPVCPEVLGGLPTPRVPCELKGLRVFSQSGEDKTEIFCLGAEKTLELALKWNIKLAVLKENSPSCGTNFVYDGSFSKKLVKGMGITAKLLYNHGFTLLSEKELDNEFLQSLLLEANKQA